jgi:membrane peptidoglycan carboxypeptidase
MSKVEAEGDSFASGTPAAVPPSVTTSTAPAVTPEWVKRARGFARQTRDWAYPRRLRLGIALALSILAAGVLGVFEVRNSLLQSRHFSSVASELGYSIGEGPSPLIRFPSEGPYDQRLGYTAIPRLINALLKHDYAIVEQTRISETAAALMDEGVFPIYHEKSAAGLELLDRNGVVFHSTPHPAHVYPAFDSIPDLIVKSLTFIENREFLDPEHPEKNPAVEWDRLGRGVLEMVLSKLGSNRNVPGGSTLATQIEKFRHSPEGRTSGPGAKLKQMKSASLRAYLDGPETLEAQKGIMLAYLNSVPLAGQRGHGEVTGTADGLWAWYGTEFDDANRLLRNEDATGEEAAQRARIYRQVLSLLIAHRRPSYYLAQTEGRKDLVRLTDEHLRLLAREGVITQTLADAALAAKVDLLASAPELPKVPFVQRKAANQVRTELLGLLGVPRLYDLDRYDLTVRTSLDIGWQTAVSQVLQQMPSVPFLRENGFGDTRLLDSGDPAKVIYSFTLLETTPVGNVVRVQTDSYDGPLNMSEAGRLELGSTAKLRTLASYLEVVEQLHNRLVPLSADSLRRMPVAPQDHLTQWALSYLLTGQDTALSAMLAAAMERPYSGNPAERFATGGGVQSFSNFDNQYDFSVLPLREAFRYSVNLPFVRAMRDVVQYYSYQNPRTTASILQDANDPGRRQYLEKFADEEGSRFLRQFYSKYDGKSGAEVLEVLVSERRLTPIRVAWAYRAVAPEAPLDVFQEFLTSHVPNSGVSSATAADLYRRADPTLYPLQDLGYLARIHPLELWLVGYLMKKPGAPLKEVLEQSKQARQDVYTWLFNTRIRSAQDTRIRTMIELEAFDKVHEQWQKLGYPFGNIVPSYGTAIGSSGDRPLALAELMGIIVNGGVRYPVVREMELHFAQSTPFETLMAVTPRAGVRVMSEEVAAALRAACLDVVANGTGRRAQGSLIGTDSVPLVVGGKTGTGDNRYRVYASGGRLVSERAVNRTATFAFFAGDRYFGVITAYVPGADADAFRFTSALPSQIFKIVGPQLGGVEPDKRHPAADSTATRPDSTAARPVTP